MNEAPIPVWVVTGPLGSGKTTALSQLVAAKPDSENWVVLLNEFTDAGIDALTVASAATGPFDVRLVPGGCLCCAGEADFRRNLNELVTITRPNRILVEPSGLGHPAGIIDELLAHQAAGRISLELIIGLMTAEDLAKVDADEITRAVAEIADVLLLSKRDLASPEDRVVFDTLVAALFPAKRASGAWHRGDSLQPWLVYAGSSEAPRSAVSRSILHDHERHRHEEHPHRHWGEIVAIGPGAERRLIEVLERQGARWLFDRSYEFSETRLMAALLADTELTRAVERFKAVVRVGEDEWVLLQRAGARLQATPTSWRRDHRLEVQNVPGIPLDLSQWDALWAHCQSTR